MNGYLREISGQDFTAKDFRTWAGTLLAVAALRELGPAATQREGKSLVLRAIDRVAEQLNNTRAVCRKYYVHPAVFETYLAGTMLEGAGEREREGRRGGGGRIVGGRTGGRAASHEAGEARRLSSRCPPPPPPFPPPPLPSPPVPGAATVTDPRIPLVALPWIVQWYGKVPAVAKVRV